LGLKDPDGDNDIDTEEQDAENNTHTENRLKRKSVAPDLEMRM
jgi:hypothetical protein